MEYNSDQVFLTNYDVTDRKFYYTLTYSIVRKRTIWEQNNSNSSLAMA